MARARAKTAEKATATAALELTCPECGRTFTRPAALGAHRKAAHGIAGAKSTAKRGRRGRRTTTASTAINGRSSNTRRTIASTRRTRSSSSDGARTVNRDALLKALFPNGVPAREETLRAVTAWLDEAERLARTK
jgi:hypothetical protein